MLLSAIGHREVPIPEHIDIYHLTREMAPSDKTALQCVMEVDEQRIMLEKEAERLAHEDCTFYLIRLSRICKKKFIFGHFWKPLICWLQCSLISEGAKPHRLHQL